MNELARDLKDISVEFNLLGTSVAQSSSVNPDLLKQPGFVMTRFNIGKHKRLVEPFSYFLTINQTPDERKSYIARIFADKLREHFTGEGVFRIKQSLKNSRFYDKKKTLQMLADEEFED